VQEKSAAILTRENHRRGRGVKMRKRIHPSGKVIKKCRPTFHMIKSKFCERLRSKTETAQINEELAKVLCHNICCVIQSIHELGIEPTFHADFADARKVK
jgi:hypothetical protein